MRGHLYEEHDNKKHMNTILITVDALRADHLGQYGYDRDTMPALDRLIEDGTLFTKAFSNGPYTRVSIPSFHISRVLGYDEVGEHPTIASELSSAGIHTSVVGTNTGWRSYSGDLGFDSYYDIQYHDSADTLKTEAESPFSQFVQATGSYLESFPPAHRLAQSSYRGAKRLLGQTDRTGPWEGSYPSAEEVTDEVIDWLRNDDHDDDFFLWTHYMEAHTPFGLHDSDPEYNDPVPDGDNKRMLKTVFEDPAGLSSEDRALYQDMYDSNLRYCSRHLNRLFDALKDQGMWDETNIVFTSDHGEEFGEHGMYYHHNFPYDELLHVPLISTGPDVESQTIDEERELLDLAPTILEFHGVDVPGSFQGRSLFEGGPRSITAVGSHEYDGQVVARRADGWKYIWTDDGEYLYNLGEDPKESNNVIESHPGIRNQHLSALPEQLFTTPPEELREPEDEADREQLKALGYID